MKLRRPPLHVVVGLATALLALGWAAHVYIAKVRARVGVGEPAHDLDVFLRAAAAVLHGHSPYGFHGDQTYAYPPLLAFLATPLHPLGVGAAMTAWFLLSFAAIAAALWLVGVRDWRCYCLVPLYPMTRSAVGLGTVGALLLLSTALAWWWRDRLVEPALAVGAAIALKLFLWPLAVWLAVTRRVRPAALAVIAALGLALVPWAAIGFAGLGGYPSLLHRLEDAEATSSYSLVAVGVRLKLPESVAVVLSLAVATGLVVLAARVARDPLRSRRDRDVGALTLVLAAALAASPIVWMHYFLLLLVPLALARPRLSPLWLVPFAYYPLGESAWPAGDARKLGISLVTTLVLVAAAARRGAGDTGGEPVISAAPRHAPAQRDERPPVAAMRAD